MDEYKMSEKIENRYCRADKLIWMIRIVRSRSAAVSLIEKKKISINNVVVKPSTRVSSGHVIAIHYPAYIRSLNILKIPPSRVSASLLKDFVLDITDVQELKKMEDYLFQLSELRKQGRGRNFKGRPEKKERRALDDFLDDIS